MKPTMMFAIMMLTAIVLMTVFNIQIAPTEPIALSKTVAANALYVCPAAVPFWDGLSNGIMVLKKPLIIAFFFALTLLLSVWAWALYQNLLKDKFIRDAYKNPWSYTKILFWTVVIVLLLMYTPNHFRSVQLTGTNTNWVLCDSNTPGAKAVNADNVHN